jgi:hypothetical protein
MNVRLMSGWAIAIAASTTFLTSCGSRDSLGYALGGGHLIPSPDPLNLSGTGSANAGTIVATDVGYAGTIETSNTCSTGAKPIASISPTSGAAPLSVTVTPQNPGTCTITFSDSNGLTHTSTINVTSSGIGVTSRSRQ